MIDLFRTNTRSGYTNNEMRCNKIDDDTYKTRPMIPEQLLAFDLKATSRSRCESSTLQQHYYLQPPMAFSPT